jgi:hypothetical protein
VVALLQGICASTVRASLGVPTVRVRRNRPPDVRDAERLLAIRAERRPRRGAGGERRAEHEGAVVDGRTVHVHQVVFDGP